MFAKIKHRKNWVETLPLALALHHDAPGPLGISPHQIVFGRNIPLAGISYSPTKQCEEAQDIMDCQQHAHISISEKNE